MARICFQSGKHFKPQALAGPFGGSIIPGAPCAPQLCLEQGPCVWCYYCASTAPSVGKPLWESQSCSSCGDEATLLCPQALTWCGGGERGLLLGEGVKFLSWGAQGLRLDSMMTLESQASVAQCFPAWLLSGWVAGREKRQFGGTGGGVSHGLKE